MSTWTRDSTWHIVSDSNEYKMANHVSPLVLIDRFYSPRSSHPSCIKLPEAKGNNYKLKPQYITMLPKFSDLESERRLHVHKRVWRGLCDDEDPTVEQRCNQVEVHLHSGTTLRTDCIAWSPTQSQRRRNSLHSFWRNSSQCIRLQESEVRLTNFVNLTRTPRLFDADIMELTPPPKSKFKECRVYQKRLKRTMIIWF